LTFIDQEAEVLHKREYAEEEAKDNFRTKLSAEEEAQ
jgi:hypothetical protein